MTGGADFASRGTKKLGLPGRVRGVAVDALHHLHGRVRHNGGGDGLAYIIVAAFAKSVAAAIDQRPGGSVVAIAASFAKWSVD